MLLNIEELRIEPDVTVLQLSGMLALGRESQRIEPMIEECINRGVQKLILDLSGVTYIDSAGIGLLALAAGRLKESDGRLLLVIPVGRVREMLDLTRVSTIIPVYPTLKEAMGLFGTTESHATP